MFDSSDPSTDDWPDGQLYVYTGRSSAQVQWDIEQHKESVEEHLHVSRPITQWAQLPKLSSMTSRRSLSASFFDVWNNLPVNLIGTIVAERSLKKHPKSRTAM
jgi:hypothetical protein